MQLKNKKILLGVTGGIAAYKAPDLVRKLVAQGASVRVVLTDSALEFVSPLALQAVSGNPVHHALLDPSAEAAMGHIELAKWADILLIAPATANCLARLAHGLADDLLSTLYLATTADVFVAPAMNQQMWAAPATQANLHVLKQRHIQFLGPAAGEQACGDVGAGRMVEPIDIATAIANAYSHPQDQQLLLNKRVLITAGPTREALDPVRYLSNHSSGKMGYAIAAAAVKAGAKVTLVSGPTNLETPPDVHRLTCSSAADMHALVMSHVADCDIFVATAAVADYRAEHESSEKIKKTDDKLTLTLVKNPDILKDVAALEPAPFTVGFAAETQNVEAYATKKLQSKKLDMIAANDVSDADIGFNSDNNALLLLWSDGRESLPRAPKFELANQLIGAVARQYDKKHNAHGTD
ncbi:bifunctional phosphopantothenoylcysteine decarboxylase/phosphopantothenate--cysteine ligase CoaBC [Alteromonas oceanisediminis]|uniref:bifunctional phosphopantothenoylcysteine decarboxylase/phosphopantothenate--cysteine ligase CoaBC n=1 Tax=Alteromonas oceanisediminis TaxID=2836180 RepID=UPI001BD9DF79|nr:bifunctional phosphopantothenoylcysteine decarboxylase/phosphopantothenate--cysteine ligase CoaBC [Alteromonas oceanisediminis]MBT0586742.1 bifunctional phosphopantothenoylcysteine decarboxylase/phosphopantothenate--cysteine ligase CoaBC [Alteromonas oceanisediminis]